MSNPRAGEAGRGFAVVANEVRALAQQSADAATRISDLISTSQIQVKQGSALVERTSESLAEISQVVTSALSHVTGIAEKAQSQSRDLDGINTNIQKLDQLTKQNAAMSQETNAEVQVLAQECQTLYAATSVFSCLDQPAAPARLAS